MYQPWHKAPGDMEEMEAQCVRSEFVERTGAHALAVQKEEEKGMVLARHVWIQRVSLNRAANKLSTLLPTFHGTYDGAGGDEVRTGCMKDGRGGLERQGDAVVRRVNNSWHWSSVTRGGAYLQP